MPDSPKYLYDPTHADSIAALSRLGRAPSSGAQTIGVFRFRGEPVRVERLDDNTFVAIRLDAAGRPRSLLDRLLDLVRSLFRLEGGRRWQLTGRDRREMESWMFAMSARALQQQMRCQREQAAVRDRRDASTLSRFEALPLPLLHAIGVRLSLQDCHALRQVCSRFAKPMAHCVPLLQAALWTTLPGLRRALAHTLPQTESRPFAVEPDRPTRAKALQVAADRVSELPASQRCAGLRSVLDAIQLAFPDGDGAAVPLRVLATELARQPCLAVEESRQVQRLAVELCRALERLPLAERIGAALALHRNPTLSITDRVRALLVPESCWLLAVRVVPAVQRRRVVDDLASLVAEPSRLPPSKAVPLALQALELAELDPGASAHALAALFRISAPAMLVQDCPPDPPDPRGGDAAFRAGMAVWERLLATASAWPTQAAVILMKALLQVLAALSDQRVKNKARLAAGRWLQNAGELPGNDRHMIEALLFALLAEPPRLAAWNAMWDALPPPTSQHDDAAEAELRQIARCLTYVADATQWESMLLPRLTPLPPQQQAALLSNLPAFLYRGPHTMELFERVLNLAVHHRLLKPLTLWYRARTLADYGQYGDALDSALVCLPTAQQAQWIVALSRNRVVPQLWIDVGLAAMEPPLPNAALQASLIGAVAVQCHSHGVALDADWRTRIAGLTEALVQLEGTAARLDTAALSALIGMGDVMLQLHDGAATSARRAWAEDAIPAFVDAVWRWVRGLPFDSMLGMLAALCAVRAPFAPSYERHFHLARGRSIGAVSTAAARRCGRPSWTCRPGSGRAPACSTRCRTGLPVPRRTRPAARRGATPAASTSPWSMACGPTTVRYWPGAEDAAAPARRAVPTAQWRYTASISLRPFVPMPADAKLIADLRRRALAAQYARPVASPCRDVCRMGQHGYCEGCFRTIDEIAGWANRRDEDKRAIWQMLPQRAAAAGTADTADAGDTGNTFDTSDTSNTGDTVQSGRP